MGLGRLIPWITMAALIATQQYHLAWYYYAGIVVAGSYLSAQLVDDVDMPSYDAAATGGAGLRANTRSTQEPIKVLYGQLRIGGNDVYMGTSGSNNEILWIVQTLGEGECEGIAQIEGVDQVFLGDKLYTEYGGNVEYWFHSGSSTQTYDTNLHAEIPEWTDNMRYTAYIVWKLTYDKDYFQSLPKRTVVLKGRKLYDFRTAGTAYSNNPVLSKYDYQINDRYGLGIAAAKFDTGVGSSWRSAADYCDTKSWTLNMSIGKDQAAQDILDAICAHFRGELVWWDGMFYLRYADLNDESSCMTLEDKHIAQNPETGKALISISEPSQFKKPNGLRVKYTDPDRDYIIDDFIIGDETGYIKGLKLIGAFRQQAADLGVYYLEREKLDRCVKGIFRDDAIKLEKHDIVTLNTTALSISSQLMRVLEADIQEGGMIDLTLLYEQLSLYDDDYNFDAEGSYQCSLPDPTAEPPSVSNVQHSEETYNYRLRTFTRLKVTFGPPANYAWYSHVEVRQAFKLLQGLVGFWDLNDGLGSIAKDKSGNGNDGILVNMEESDWKDGIAGKCLDFDGIDEHVDLGAPSGLNITGLISITSWAKRDSSGNGDFIIDRRDSGSIYHLNYSFGFNSNDKIQFYYRNAIDNAWHIWHSTTTITDTNWHFLGVTFTFGTGSSIKIYLDGEEIAGSWTSGSGNDAVYNSATLDVWIGADTLNTNNFDGKIDEVRVYNRVLTETEIKALYNSPDNPVVWEYLYNVNTDFELDPVEEGVTYYLRLKTVSIWGTKQQDNNDYKISRTIQGHISNPASLAALYAIVNANCINLYAAKVSDPDVELYEFRLGGSWSGAVFMAALRSPNLSLTGVKPGSHTFIANTLSNNAGYGATPRSASVSLKDPPDAWAVQNTETCDYNGVGTHDNTEHTTYDSDDYLKCSHTGGVLVGTYKSPIYDRGSSARYMVYILAGIVVTGAGTTWGDVIPSPDLWSEIGITTRMWAEIFSLSAGPSVAMKLKYGETSPPTNEVEKMEILSAIVTGRYFQIEIEITDPSDAVNALVENFTMKFCQ